jgi:hypothetical protein
MSENIFIGLSQFSASFYLVKVKITLSLNFEDNDPFSYDIQSC